jgi:putative acetyltransferase
VRTRPATPADGERVLAIWAAAVDATHEFLSPEDRAAVGREVAAFLPGAPLTLAEDTDGRVLGFLLVNGYHAEALFVDPAAHGRGVGRTLIASAVVRSVDVNEANAGALAFYRRLGFIVAGRSERDGQGRPYPLLHLRRE